MNFLGKRYALKFLAEAGVRRYPSPHNAVLKLSIITLNVPISNFLLPHVLLSSCSATSSVEVDRVRSHCQLLSTLSAFALTSKTWNCGRRDLTNPPEEFSKSTAADRSRPGFWRATFALSNRSKISSHNVAMTAVSSLYSFFRRGCASMRVSQVSASSCASVRRQISMH